MAGGQGAYNPLKQKITVFTQKVLYSYEKRIKIVSTSGSDKHCRLLLPEAGGRCSITIHQMKIFRKKEVAWRERLLFGWGC